MDIKKLSIEQLKSHRQTVSNDNELDFLQDDLIITNSICYVELFRSPCRIDAFIMAICLKGEFICTANLKQYVLGRNNVFVGLPTDIIHVDSTIDLEMYTIFISDSFLRDLNIDISKLMQLYLSVRRHSTASIADNEIELLDHYFALILESIRTKDTNARDIIRGLLTALIYQIMSYVRKHYATPENATNKKLHRNEFVYDKFRVLLSEFYIKEHNVKFYANKLCITPKYLSVIVKKVSGKSAVEWINEYIVLEAKSRLRLSNMSIQQIAYHLNFSTQSSFGKYFKHQTGFSPKQFVNQLNHFESE